jgi:hypothetical protein
MIPYTPDSHSAFLISSSFFPNYAKIRLASACFPIVQQRRRMESWYYCKVFDLYAPAMLAHHLYLAPQYHSCRYTAETHNYLCFIKAPAPADTPYRSPVRPLGIPVVGGLHFTTLAM